MSKNIFTPRDELVCGKIDAAFELAIKLESVELIDLLGAIRYDCERMEQALIRRKIEVESMIEVQKELVVNLDGRLICDDDCKCSGRIILNRLKEVKE